MRADPLYTVGVSQHANFAIGASGLAPGIHHLRRHSRWMSCIDAKILHGPDTAYKGIVDGQAGNDLVAALGGNVVPVLQIRGQVGIVAGRGKSACNN